MLSVSTMLFQRVWLISDMAKSRGDTLEDGLKVMVIGMPNVGKSSLLNALRRVGVHKGKTTLRVKCLANPDRESLCYLIATWVDAEVDGHGQDSRESACICLRHTWSDGPISRKRGGRSGTRAKIGFDRWDRPSFIVNRG